LLRRAGPSDQLSRLVRRTARGFLAVLLFYVTYWTFVPALHLRGIMLGYLALPAVQLWGELSVCLLGLL
jgi:hypothetical protein